MNPLNHLIILASLLISSIVNADELTFAELLGEAPEFEADIPRPEDVAGVKVGERHWYHHEIMRYLDTLADSSPRMVALGEYAKSYGGRGLNSYAISSESNLARLNEIKASRADILNPAAEVNLDDQPAVLHMMYSVHGNEPSAANVTPLLAYYLNAVKDPAIAEQLEEVVIILNPILNPDGHDRFANWTNNNAGLNPSTDPNDREHREPTPNGRTNYYWFDLNRDWLPHQHPESQGRLALFHEWKPNVQLDFHEMGRNATYFFMPGKPERTNPLTPAINQELTAKIAAYHAQVFDREGVTYYSEEGFDDFYMGKGSTYPDLFGCVGILFEQASARGVHQDTVNGLLTFRTALTNQFHTSLSSLEGTAALSDELLAYQRDFYTRLDRQRGYYLATADDSTRLREFVRLMQGHDITVEVLAEDVRAGGVNYQAGGTIAIPLDQPQASYLTSLWQRQLDFEEDVFYDVSTWTMPWAFNLTHTREAVRSVETSAMAADFLGQGKKLEESQIGYLIDWRDSASPALLYDLLEAGAQVRVAERPLTARVTEGEIPFGYGTLFVSPQLGKQIPADAMALLQASSQSGLPVYSVISSLTPSGIDLGSRDFTVLEQPKVLLVTGPGTSAYATGELWHLLDRRVQMPISRVEPNRLSTINLNDYSHVLLTNPLSALPDSVTEKVQDFVTNGGILWAQGSSTLDWLRKSEMTDLIWRETATQLTARKLKEKQAAGKSDAADLEALLPERRAFADARDDAAFRLVRGAILEGSVDVSHPLGYGYSSEFLPMFRRTAKFMALAENAYSSPVVYAESPLLSGYMSDENRTLAGGSAGIIVSEKGQGAIVMVLDRVAFRAFWWGTQRLLVNAIFFGELLEEPN